jgi:hypothetical protein
MPKKTPPSIQFLIDAVRPAEADGALQSVVMATYGLSLEQPNFFEQDFLPTLLGLGSVRDRGYGAPVNLERKLAEVYCALMCDAHALAEGGRPSLRIDVIPVARPRHHAKIVLIHRKRLIRLIVSSANLTHDGYRSQREVAAVLDFRPDGTLSANVLVDALSRWTMVLGDSATSPIRNALQRAVAASEGWSPPRRGRTAPTVRVVFGGEGKPLWQELVDAWPANEPLLSWQVCSPFWPAAEAKSTPFDVIAGGLKGKAVSMTNTVIELICSADVPGDRGRPVFPFSLLRGLRERGFPVRRGRIVPARLETLADEVPDRKTEGHRVLHAKWIVLRGPNSAVALLGSANFTNPGLGVGNPGSANIETGILLTCAVDELPEGEWCPPLVDSGSVDWASSASNELAAPAADPDDPLDWPEHIRRIELDIHWGDGPDPSGTLHIDFIADRFFVTELASPEELPGESRVILLALDHYPSEKGGHAGVEIDAATVRRLLVNRTVRVCWDQPVRQSLFPINILETAKAGLPSILGARPNEQQLLAYFHGRIGEDDLLLLLEQRALDDLHGLTPQSDESPSVELQSYLIREFVESLFGLQNLLKSAMFSPRAFEQALLGEFSPATLGERIQQAFLAGRRSATATAFQLTELLRVVSGLSFENSDIVSDVERTSIEGIKDGAVVRLLSLVETAGQRGSFKAACRNTHLMSFVHSSLPNDLAERFLSVVVTAAPDTVDYDGFVPTKGTAS